MKQPALAIFGPFLFDFEEVKKEKKKKLKGGERQNKNEGFRFFSRRHSNTIQSSFGHTTRITVGDHNNFFSLLDPWIAGQTTYVGSARPGTA